MTGTDRAAAAVVEELLARLETVEGSGRDQAALRVQEVLDAATGLPLADVGVVVAACQAAMARWSAPAGRCPSTSPRRRPGCFPYRFGHEHKGQPASHAERCMRNGKRREYAHTLPLIRPGREGRDAVVDALASMEVPARPALSQAEWMGRVPEDVDLVLRKSDHRRNVAAVVQPLAWRAQWHATEPDEVTDGLEMTTRPTRALLAELASVSERTVTRIITYLRRRGWLALVEAGTTAAIRAGLLFPLIDLYAGEGNRAAVYLLTIPTTEAPLSSIEGTQDGQNGPADQGQDADPITPDQDHKTGVCINLSPLPCSVVTPATTKTTTAGAHASARTRGSGESQTYRTKDSSTRGRIGIHSRVATGRWTQRDRLRAAEAARAADPVLETLSARAVRSLLTPWWAAGWTIADVIYALNFQPSGERWPARYLVSDLRNVTAWINWRLDHWRDAQGEPLPGVSQAQRARAEAEAAKVEAFAAAMAAADAPPTPPARAEAGFAIFRAARKAMHTP